LSPQAIKAARQKGKLMGADSGVRALGQAGGGIHTETPWWDADKHRDRRGFLRVRQEIKRALRSWFEARDFTEVEAGILAVSPGNEAHLHAFCTEALATDGVRSPLYLHTSPEFACKKLLAAGETAIFDFARVFRNRERGALHAPEFTMLEWYRVGADYSEIIADTVELIRLAASLGGQKGLTWRGQKIALDAPLQRITVANACARWAGIDVLATLHADRPPDRDGLASQAIAAGIRIANDDNWSDIFSRILVEKIEPELGRDGITVLDEYPAVEAALARRCAHDRRVAERFEVYVCGVELANGFGELTDPAEQRTRFEAEMVEKQRIYGERYPIDEDFLAALAYMPPASGVALGFDRLVMLSSGASRIDQVIWTPLPGAP
jgi:lysyl-tRNA synthetase class 2